ncbi:MAG: hypothetical protein AAF503_11595 [Pseudomonadota bacterium]
MKRPRQILKSYVYDEAGSITTEFVLWIPLLMTWFMLSVVLYDANKNRNDAAKAAYTISDLISRKKDVDNAYLEQLKSLEDNLLPRTAGSHTLRLTSLRFVDGTYEVVWSKALGGGLPLTSAELNPAAFPTTADTDSLIVTEIDVPYTPLSDWVGITAKTWSFDVVSRPRFANPLQKTD